jgi:hypothetical protein
MRYVIIKVKCYKGAAKQKEQTSETGENISDLLV